MGRSRCLSDYEKGVIDGLHSANKSYREIALEIDRSFSAVRNYLKNKDSYGKSKSSGRPRKISSRARRQLFKDLTNSGDSIPKVKFRNNVDASRWTVWRAIKDEGKFAYVKRQKAPSWKPHHITNRINWAISKVTWTEKWLKVYFSDEKKWNLDGPDGCHYYWHDLRKEEKFFKSRQFGGGSVMTWDAFCASKKTEIVFLEGKQNSKNYIETFKKYMEPVLSDQDIFQQDNAPIHVSKESKEYFSAQNTALLEWPSLSPDLNPIENVWGIMVREVYGEGKQYEDKESLKKAIKIAWENVTLTTLEKLSMSMHKRCVKLLQLNGSYLSY